MIADAMMADHLAGVAVAVVQEGATVLLKGYGMSALDPVRPVDPQQTLFRVGSISKTFTWIALMKEVERGRIRLDAPVNDYLPQELKIPDAEFRKPVSVIDLMSHAAGFSDGELGFLIVKDPERVISLKEYLRQYPPRRVREPGVLASYSNYGAALAGYIVSRIHGQPYESVIEEEIIRPLGLLHTTFREPLHPHPDLPAPMSMAHAENESAGFDWVGGRFETADREYLSQVAPAGAASMSVADAARYMLMQLNGGTCDDAAIYGARSAEAFRSSILSVPAGVNGWAHGFAATVLPGGYEAFGHSGATTNFFANMVIVPRLRLGIFIVTNTSSGWPITRRFPELLTAHFYAAPSETHLPGSPHLAAIADRYAGAYLTTRRPYAGLEKFVDLLSGTATVAVTPDGYLRMQYGPLDTAWVPAGAPGHFRSVRGAEHLVFKLDRQGRAVSFPLFSGNATLERVSVLWTRLLFDVLGLITLTCAGSIALVAAASWRRTRPATRWQSRFGTVSLLAAALWLIASFAFRRWQPQADSGEIMYNFPGFWLTTASATALAAAMVSVVLLLASPLAWRSDGKPGWPWWQKAGYTSASVVFVAFALLLASWGALRPWVLR